MTNRLDVAWTLTACVALTSIGVPSSSRGDDASQPLTRSASEGEQTLTRSASEDERSTKPSIPSSVERPPSLALRVSETNEPISLVYKFQANQSLHYHYSQQMTMDVKKGGFKQHLETETISHKHLRIISVDADGQALVEPVVDTARMKSREDDRVTEFDSAEGRENCPSQYRRLFDSLGKPLVRIKFSPNGKLLKATGVNGGEKAAQGLQDDATLNFLVVFPDRPLQVGETWNDDFEVFAQVERSLKQAIKVRREYRLAKLDGSEATIEMKLGTITPMNNPAIELQIASRLVSGTIVFDHVVGKIVRRELSVDRQVINALGNGSLVHTTMTQSEIAASPLPPVAGREEAARD